MVTNSQTNDIEQRFGYLLQPIRDLTKNWNIDLASQLEEYLEELEGVTVSFDNGATVMNFTEAALVIQGSTSVYSKKVEYLFSLTSQVLDMVVNKKKKRATHNDEESDANTNDANDDPEEFLTLDDGEEERNIELKDRANRLSNVHILPVVPSSLISLTIEDKTACPLLNKNGDMVARRSDFHFNISTPHSSGAMLLENGEQQVLHFSFLGFAATAPDMGRDDGPPPTDDAIMGDNCVDEGHHSDLSIGIDLDDQVDFAVPEIVETTQGHACLRSKRVAEKVAEKPPSCEPVHKENPYEPLDAHSANAVKSTQFVKGKPFTVPAILRNRKRKTTNIARPPTSITDYIERMFTTTKSVGQSQRVAYKELDEMIVKETQRRKSITKTRMSSEHRELVDIEEIDTDDVNDAGDPFMRDLIDDNDDESNDGEFCSAAEPIDDTEVVPSFPPPHTSMADGGSAPRPYDDIVTSFEELVRRHIDGFMLDAQRLSRKTELELTVAHWETRIMPILEDLEKRPVFDIHKYGAWILEHLVDGVTTPFGSLMAEQPPPEICRYFLACLQLANHYNVRLSMDSLRTALQLELLDRTIRSFSLNDS